MSDFVLTRPNADGGLQAQIVSDQTPEGRALIIRYQGTSSLQPLTPELEQSIGRQQQVDRNARNLEATGLAPLVAAGGGILDEATLGLFERNLTPTQQLRVQGARQASPIGNLAGRVGLNIAGAALTGGASETALGARGAAEGAAQTVGALTQAGVSNLGGRFVESAVARALAARGVEGAAQRVAAFSSGAVADATVGGTLGTITDANIADQPLSGEALAANVGLGVLLAGGAAGIHGLGELAQMRRFSARGAQTLVENGLGDASVHAQAANANGYVPIGPRVEPPRAEGLDADFLRTARAYNMTSEGQTEQMLNARRWADENGVQWSHDLEQARRQAFNRETAGAADTAIAEQEVRARPLMEASTRQAALYHGMTDAGPEAVSQAQEALRSLADDLDTQMARGVDPAVVGPARRLRGLIDDDLLVTRETVAAEQAAFEQARLQHSLGLLAEAPTAPPVRRVPTAEELAVAIDNSLQQIRNNDMLHGIADPELQGIATTFRDGRQAGELPGDAGRLGLRDTLGLLGSRGRQAQRVHASLDNLEASWRRGTMSRFGRVNRATGDFRIDTSKLSGALEDSVYHMRDETLPDLDRAFNDMAELSAVADEVDGLGIGRSLTETSLRNVRNRLVKAREWSTHAANLRGVNAALVNNAGFRAALPFMGGAVGGLIGGPVGAVMGAAATGALALAGHPIDALRYIGGASRGVARTQSRLGEGIARLGRFLSGQTVGGATKAVARLPSLFAPGANREEMYGDLVSRVRELAANPAALEAHLDQAMGPAAHYLPPRVGGAVAMSVVNGVQYLAMSLPPADMPDPFSHTQAPRKPSTTEMRDFLRRAEALDDPLILLDLAAQNRLSLEHVEAVQAAYPSLLADIRARATEMLSELKKRPTYAQRAQLSTLLGIDSDPSLQGTFILRLQQTYSQTAEQRIQTPGASRARETTQNTFTSSQRIETRL